MVVKNKAIYWRLLLLWRSPLHVIILTVLSVLVFALFTHSSSSLSSWSSLTACADGTDGRDASSWVDVVDVSPLWADGSSAPKLRSRSSPHRSSFSNSSSADSTMSSGMACPGRLAAARSIVDSFRLQSRLIDRSQLQRHHELSVDVSRLELSAVLQHQLNLWPNTWFR